jgi:urease gamma subunit
MTASELKKLVTQVRRTDTALRHLAAQLDLNEADKASLLKAASVLSASGRQVATQVTQTRRTEEVREKAIARATQEAKQLMAGWQVVSISDKVALCVANLMETHLRQNLASDFDNLEWSLNYWVEQALAEIPMNAAWRAVRDGKPVSELMALASERLDRIRIQPGTIALAQRWQTQMETADRKSMRWTEVFHDGRSNSPFCRDRAP